MYWHRRALGQIWYAVLFQCSQVVRSSLFYLRISDPDHWIIFVGSKIENTQNLISVRNRVLSDVAWFNADRVRKPQNFKKKKSENVSVATKPESCDFCKWPSLTASDTFGRIEGKHAVSASNLFKYVAPMQGLVLFKHHEPLEFTYEQLSDLLDVAHRWFAQSYNICKLEYPEVDRDALHPLLVWNALGRAGASQYHGHAQLMLSSVPFPDEEKMQAVLQHYDGKYFDDLVDAHECIGLVRKEESALMFPSVCPLKDGEILVHGSSLGSRDFHRMVYIALRALIDELGSCSFNIGIMEMRQKDEKCHPMDGPIFARIVSRDKKGSKSMASDFGGLEVFTGASIGHTDPWHVVQAIDAIMTTERE